MFTFVVVAVISAVVVLLVVLIVMAQRCASMDDGGTAAQPTPFETLRAEKIGASPADPSTPRAVWIGVMLFAGVFIATGVFGMLWGVSATHEAYASQSWPSVSGQVTSSHVETDLNNDSLTTIFGAAIRYTYTFQGQEYTGECVSCAGVSTSDWNDAQRIVDRYPVGKSVRVFYNPAKPQESVLETGPRPALLMLLGMGGVFTLMGSLMLFFFLRSWLIEESQRGDGAALRRELWVDRLSRRLKLDLVIGPRGRPRKVEREGK